MHLRQHVLFLALLASVPAQGQVWIVDAKGGAGVWRDTIGLMAHVRDGDLIVLRAGTYSPLRIGNKTVTIARDARTGKVALKGLTITGLQSNKRIAIRGLEITVPSIHTNRGAIVLERCALLGGAFLPMVLRDSLALTFSRCTSIGTLHVENSTVQLHDCQLKGGLLDRTGARLKAGATLIARGSEIAGADARRGGVSGGSCYNIPIPGGDGLVLEPGSRAECTNCVLRGGAPARANPPCPGASGGADVDNRGGVLRRRRGPVGKLYSWNLVREGERVRVEIHGEPGAPVALIYSLDHGMTPVPGCGAALFPALTNLGVLSFGALGTGPLILDVVVQPLAAGTNFLPLHVQAWMLPKSGCALTAPSSITLLSRKY